jgi:hypothetical protein
MQDKSIYQAEYAGYPIKYAFRMPGTAALFGSWLQPAIGKPDIFETEEYFTLACKLMPNETKESAEFRSLICLTSKHLLKHGCCFMHAVAFEMDGFAWILSAPSGTGKTTQYLNWQRQFPGEARMISGDAPLIEASEKVVFAHSSPWNGKEKLGNQLLCAPIGGVILLRQGSEDRLERLSTAECIQSLLSQFIVRLETEEEVRSFAGIADRLISAVPVLRFDNLGGAESTELLRNELKRIVHERKGE